MIMFKYCELRKQIFFKYLTLKLCNNIYIIHGYYIIYLMIIYELNHAALIIYV